MKRNKNKNTRNPKNPSTKLYRALTRLMSGPIVDRRRQHYHREKRRDLEKYNFNVTTDQSFKKNIYSPYQRLASNMISNQGRIERYVEFDEMMYEPIIGTALKIYAMEVTTFSSIERLLKINCPNEEIRVILEELFYNKLNIERNLYSWVFEMCKKGDYFLYLDIDPELGIKHVIGLPAAEIERLEGEDEDNPSYVQFQWNSNGTTFENWQMAHFRILGNDKYVPYGECLKYDTRVLTSDGVKEIKDIKKGDEVVSFELETQRKITSKVLDTVCNGSKECFKIRTRHNELEATKNHKILICDENDEFVYKFVEDLKIGDRLITNKSHQSQPIIHIEASGKHEVYDIHVSNSDHNFYANGVVVHNSVLEPARRIFRQLELMENAMIGYRVVRGTERRLVSVEVGGIPDEEIPHQMELISRSMKKNTVLDADTGRADIRYDPYCHFPNDYVYLCDGSMKRIKEIGDNWTSDSDLYVWSLDKNHNVVPSKLIWAGKTKEDAEFIEVELDDGQIIKTTPEHKWMLRDGTFIEAQNLTEGTSLMPFYADVCRKTTQRRSEKKNFYPKIYNPGNGKYTIAHKLVAKWKYGNYKWPYVIHHVDHVKYNNHPSNLQKMHQSDHMRLHEEISKKLTKYAKSSEGRKKSSETMLRTHRTHDMNKLAYEARMKPEVREIVKEKLTLKTDSRLIHYVVDAINNLGTSAKNYQIIDFLNNNKSFTKYLSSLNKNFKNGNKDKILKMQLLNCLRKNNLYNIREVKDLYVSLKAPWDKVLEVSSRAKSRKEVQKFFNISRWDLTRLINNHSMSLREFDKLLASGGYYKTKKIKKETNVTPLRNHKIVRVSKYSKTSDAYGLTVENSTHVLAVGGENAPMLRNKTWKSGVFVHNSVEEDIFVPKRGDLKAAEIDILKSGEHVGAIDDVIYLKDKLFAALAIPQSYLFRGEGANEDKATLSQKDIMFGRIIQMIQQSVVSELEKMAIIHLYTLGYTGKDLTKFKLTLNNPSKISEMQDLEAWRLKFEIASSATEGFFSKRFLAENIFGLSHKEFERMQLEAFYDNKYASRIETLSDISSAEVASGQEGEVLDDLANDGIDDLASSEEDLTPEDEDLLVAPGKRDEPSVGEKYTTPGAKGKYYEKRFDNRKGGARRRSMESRSGSGYTKSTRTNLQPGSKDIDSLSHGVYEYTRLNNEVEKILESLEELKKEKSDEKKIL